MQTLSLKRNAALGCVLHTLALKLKRDTALGCVPRGPDDVPRFDAIEELIRLGDRGELPSVRVLKAAAAELVDIEDRLAIVPAPEPATVARATAVRRLIDEGLPRRVICRQLNISRDQFNRARRVAPHNSVPSPVAGINETTERKKEPVK